MAKYYMHVHRVWRSGMPAYYCAGAINISAARHNGRSREA